MRLGDPAVNEIRQDLQQPFRERCAVMAPAPDGHPANSERTGGGGIAAERDLENHIEPAAGQTAFEAR